MERLKIRDKRGRLIPFLMNASQMILAQYVAWCWHSGVAPGGLAKEATPVRAIDPKYRQGGVTTFWALLFVAICVLSIAWGIAYRVAVVAHTDDGARKIFRVYRTAVDNLPPEYNARTNPLYRLRSKSQGRIEWAKGGSIQCHSVKTADALGRGDTLNAIHYSEAGNFADNGLDAAGAMAAIENCLHDDADSIVAIESTANGHDELFWPICESSRKGNESDFTLLFLPWFLDPGYRLSWATYRQRVLANPANDDPGEAFVPTEEELLLRSALDHPVPAKEAHYRYRTRLTDEQLIWRRWTIRNKCKGDHARFKREYPSTYEEAFSASEQGLFPADLLAHYRSRAKDPERRGHVELDERTHVPTFVPHPHGELAVWEEPIPGDSYTLVVDTSEGLGQDFSAAYVFNDRLLRIEAAIHGQYEWEALVPLLEAAGYYYNVALIVVELNGHGASVAAALRRHAYRRLYWLADPEASRSSSTKPGWVTSKKNRGPAINALAEALRSRRLISFDLGLVNELATFVKNERKGRYEASSGKNDDRVMAAAIACYLLQADGTLRQEAPGETERSPVQLRWQQVEKRAKDMKRRARRGVGRGVYL